TMDLKINFIRGIAREIDHIFVKAKVISIGRRVIVAHAEVRDPDNWLMASGTANCMRLMPADENPTIVES
ncbi:MAG: PaaI family thioesterase, partial [Firmicutes bacterium]|nr:PaaI family thioesterase [Bacillota bacterium]